MTLHFNQPEHKVGRQTNRAAMPKAEVLLWSILKGRKLLGLKFRRQYGIDAYLLDFYCPEVKLAIELDGETHYVEGAQVADSKRQKFIESYEIQVLRFLNGDVYENLEGVWDAIERAAKRRIDQRGIVIKSPRREMEIRRTSSKG